ncbi:MAG: acyl-CoA dehydrogenase family protein [Acidimicrobiia bacterium]
MDRTLDAFRAEVAAWFAANTPMGWRRSVNQMSHAEYVEFSRGWLRLLNTRGYGAAHVSKQWGGGGYTPREQVVIMKEWARHDGPPLDMFEISLYHAPSTFAAAGTPEQQARFIRPALDGEIWCQGFSEPEAGSDLAGLRTRAIAVDDGFRITGQKIWSSHADDARYCLLLARTDPDAPTHSGITYFVLDLQSPGVEIRPIKQNTGHSEFCEIFLDDVHVGHDCVIGAVNDGWRVAQSTLQAERGILGLELIERMAVQLDRAAGIITDRYNPPAADGPLSSIHRDLAHFRGRLAAVASLAYDIVDLMEADADSSGSLASLMKVSFTELLQDLMKWLSHIDDQQSLIDPGQAHFGGFVTGDWALDWIGSWGWTIAAGTNEIQRNIIAERVLGLPRERKA